MRVPERVCWCHPVSCACVRDGLRVVVIGSKAASRWGCSVEAGKASGVVGQFCR